LFLIHIRSGEDAEQAFIVFMLAAVEQLKQSGDDEETWKINYLMEKGLGMDSNIALVLKNFAVKTSISVGTMEPHAGFTFMVKVPQTSKSTVRVVIKLVLMTFS
jgi:hypothetical protein